MNTGIYETVSYISFSIAAVMLACSIILFWKLDMRRIIGELTGKTAKKAIEELIGATEPLNRTEKLMDAEIEDETKLLEEFPSIPVKQEHVGFRITKDEIYVHEEEATELLTE